MTNHRSTGQGAALAGELERLDKQAYPAPWCWEQCGEMSDDPVIGGAWWEDDDSYTPIAGKVEPSADNIDRPLYREAIALEMPSHADGSASANAALIVALRNNLPTILAALSHQEPDAGAVERVVEAAKGLLSVFSVDGKHMVTPLERQQPLVNALRHAIAALSADPKGET